MWQAPADANAWNVTDYSRWASVGQGQLHASCPFLEVQAVGGLVSRAGSNSGCRDRELKPMEKAWTQGPTTVSCYFAYVE